MTVETGGEASSESGALSEVEAAAFSDTTPIEETFEGEEEGESTEENIEEESEDIPESEEEGESEEGEEEASSFTDLEAANKHISKLNRENARRRTEAKEYENVFGKFDADSKSRLLEIVDELAENPEAGARTLLQVAKNILGEDALAPEPEIDENQPLTMKQWKDLQAKEEARKEQDRKAQKEKDDNDQAVKAIFNKAEELGYKEANPERHLLFSVAAATPEHGGTSGDIEKAHQKVQEFKQSIIDDYLAGKSTQRDSFPVTGEGAQPSNTGTGPKTWDDFIDQATEMARANENIGR